MPSRASGPAQRLPSLDEIEAGMRTAAQLVQLHGEEFVPTFEFLETVHEAALRRSAGAERALAFLKDNDRR
ncbi:MAG: hypothetical protein AAFO79_00295 [Pseudomonadota bacterium]